MNGVTRNRWDGLRAYTAARIAPGRAGNGLPTESHLRFQLDHARARDAVQLPLDTDAVTAALQRLGQQVLLVSSKAADRGSYLQRPDLGRQLAGDDLERLAALQLHTDIAVVVADGLSSRAVHEHAAPLLQQLLPALSGQGFSLAPLVLVEQGRVAIGDEIGAALGARLSLLLIGERPGLSSPDSLGVYLTFDPRPGRVDAERNCVSNIRPPHGLGYERAADTCLYLIRSALRRGISGVALKDDSVTLEHGEGERRVTFFRDV